ncbi:MAG: hypothetical protein KIG95_05740, partial [Comamonas sp.]|nr:hypothetical protein [Comamonas sp.]
MTISPAFQPAYDFSDDLQPTVLATGAVEMVFSDGQRCQGTGDWVLIVQPRPKILLRVKLPDAVIASGLLDFRDDDDLKVFYRSKEIKGFLKKRLFWSQEFSEFFWVPESLPYEEGEMDDACTTHVISHVFNFPDFSGECRGRKVAPPGHKTLLLECEEWRIALQSLAGDATVVGWNRARKEERCSLTHVLKLERIDGKPFSGEAASEHLWLLSWFLSFAVGRDCSAVCHVGFGHDGETVWRSFHSPEAPSAPQTWFHEHHGDMLEELFPLFAKYWRGSDEAAMTLRRAIHWYTQANTDGKKPSIYTSIIVSQAALELLAWQYLVKDGRLILESDDNKFGASGKIRLMLKIFGIPLGFNKLTLGLTSRYKKLKWEDQVHAMVVVRNSLVHPKAQEDFTDCLIDAWKLGLHYTELTILFLCGYQGKYQDRLHAGHGQTKPRRVPWHKAQG